MTFPVDYIFPFPDHPAPLSSPSPFFLGKAGYQWMVYFSSIESFQILIKWQTNLWFIIRLKILFSSSLPGQKAVINMVWWIQILFLANKLGNILRASVWFISVEPIFYAAPHPGRWLQRTVLLLMQIEPLSILDFASENQVLIIDKNVK